MYDHYIKLVLRVLENLATSRLMVLDIKCLNFRSIIIENYFFKGGPKHQKKYDSKRTLRKKFVPEPRKRVNILLCEIIKFNKASIV